MDDSQIDVLVNAIADRVQARMRGSAGCDGNGGCGGTGGCSDTPRPDGRKSHASACGSCDLPADGCLSCGLNPTVMDLHAFKAPKIEPSEKEMARYIDHTLLKPDAAREQIEALCTEARKHNFFSVCVNSSNVRIASSFLGGCGVKVCAVVGFPLGAGTPGSKAYEAREAVRCGADEIDMVMNIGAMRSRDYALIVDDISKVVHAVPGKVVKVILETGMLTDSEKVIACGLAKVAGAAFVKTSTGFGPGGATVEDITLMRSIVGNDMGVKASGGVRDYATGLAMLRAGANRLGCSSSVAIVTGGKGSGGY